MAPERVTPGTSAMHCASPMSRPSSGVSERSARSCAARRSATTKTALKTIRPIAIVTSCLSMVLTTSLRARPTRAIGIDPMTTARANRKSGSRRPSPLARLPKKSREELEDVLEEEHHGGQDRADLDDGGEPDQGVVLLEPEQLLGDEQVTRARHRQELRDPLDDPEDHGLHDVHGRLPH